MPTPTLASGGPSKPKEPDPKDDEEPPSTRLDEQWKWMLAGFVVAMVGYTSWRLWSEAVKVRPREKRCAVGDRVG